MNDLPKSKEPKTLPAGYALQSYRIIKVLGQGGFGVTYLANDTNLDRDVAIKEFLPREIAKRGNDYTIQPINETMVEYLATGMERFTREARTLSKFNHNNIVRVHTVLEENNTAYMVMSYEHGISFYEKLMQDGQPSEEELSNMILGLLDGLEVMHEAGFIHRDIKPGNIFIREDGTAILLDFGSARQAIGEETMTLTKIVTPGYAPFEQYYGQSSMQGPWTDIYSLGATCYRAITGDRPMDATSRNKSTSEVAINEIWEDLDKHSKRYSTFLLRAIEHSLRSRCQDRPQTVNEWRGMLVDPSVSTQTQWRLAADSYRNKHKTKSSNIKKSSQQKYLWPSIILIAILIITVLYFTVL